MAPGRGASVRRGEFVARHGRCSLVAAMLHLPLALLLAGTPDLDAARVELDTCATRIEALKAERRRGQSSRRELERLLVRAQELAAELQRARADLPLAPPTPSPEELLERADAARDHADRLSAAIAELDVKIGDARWGPHAVGASPVSTAAIGGRFARRGDRLEELLGRRAALAEERERAEREAARYEAEAADSAR
jgi:chromosome segregation ATPase